MAYQTTRKSRAGVVYVTLHSERVRYVRKHLGDKIDIMVDVNTRYTWLDCQRALPALEECNIYWLEEPFTPDAS